ncbi:cyclopropane-fatty-acyl-phospholipid synthase family protein [Streptomyces sp. NBC_01142]|uniref:SAM-dependent methyltransferase n=1 Tax=Streptomyces sp. NBC_01142 TaxID=2975865 RepID=UPI00225B6E37|nr:cyclopropane-fatty-acyl-phospholipid synthase family protein [Streptomyces sp. NBC_01142]MCX4821899.1 cyclopropane-fatty-acyl-phospholipid synthase family protein [Streptomyces sp. NBC_01142]
MTHLPRTSPLRAAVIERCVRRALRRLPLRVRLAGREPIGLGGPLMEVRDPHAFFRRIGAEGLIGFGESYLAGEWEARDLVGVLTVLAEHDPALVPEPLQRLGGGRATSSPRRPAAYRNTAEGSRDLSNELFALFLDETLSYSSALFRGFPAEQHLLPAAQQRKIDRLLDLAQVGPGTQLLELGTGWGESAIRAAQRGARVLTVTPSREQQALARQRVRAAGLEGRVTVLLRDYRKVLGSFDAIVSVEAAEAVGEEHWPEYFMSLDRLLAPGGRIALQAVTVPHTRLPASHATSAWSRKYLFPGGMLPSTERIDQIVAGCTALRVAERDGFGLHYAETLRLWRERFTGRANEVAALGYDEAFRRMWTFCLAHFEAGFRAGCLEVQQLLLTKGETGRPPNEA